MRITYDGKVGIGTSNPGYTLDVNGTVNATTINGGSCGLGGNFPGSFFFDGEALYVNNTASSGRSYGVTAYGRTAIVASSQTGNSAFLGTPSYAGDFSGDVRVSGNVGFGAQTRQMLNLYGTLYGIGVQSSTVYFRSDGGYFAWYWGGVHTDGVIDPGGGTRLMWLDYIGNAYANSFNNTSDRNVKANFAPASGREILQRLAGIQIQTWVFTNKPTVRHIGPMAQDFHAAFGVGEDDKHIGTIDSEGVALAAIQGLNEAVTELRAEVQAKDERIARLETSLKELEKGDVQKEARLNKIERSAAAALGPVENARSRK
jgi:hypothetical protein